MTYISKRMFRLCRNLKHIHIPSNIKEIMSSAFSSCEAVENIVLDEVVERIGPDVFENGGRSNGGSGGLFVVLKKFPFSELILR